MLKVTGPTAIPGSDDGYLIRPELMEYIARIWQIGMTRETVPMLKLESRLAPNSIEDRTLAATLQPFDHALRKFTIYLEHTRPRTGMPDWSVGSMSVDGKGASVFLYGVLDHRIGPVVATLMSTSNARFDIAINLIPVRVDSDQLRFEVSDYDLGVKSRIS
jgi:hypothetical protein